MPLELVALLRGDGGPFTVILHLDVVNLIHWNVDAPQHAFERQLLDMFGVADDDRSITKFRDQVEWRLLICFTNATGCHR